MDQLEELKRLVRIWYGSLPINILILNTKLQKLITEFEKSCEQEIQRLTYNENRIVSGNAGGGR